MSIISAPSLQSFELAHCTVHIRLLVEYDCRVLEWHGGPDLRSFYETQWQRHQHDEITVLVADFNNYPIGQAAIHWQGKNTHPDVPDIQSVRVHPAFRGQGIGTHLLTACERVAAERGERRISLAVGIENHAARRLYERLGYRVTGEQYLDKWHYTDACGELVYREETVFDLLKTL